MCIVHKFYSAPAAHSQKRMQNTCATFYIWQALKKLMVHVQSMTRQAESLDRTTNFVLSTMEEFRYLMCTQSFTPLLAGFHEVQARIHFRTGDTDKFVVSMLRSRLAAHRHGHVPEVNILYAMRQAAVVENCELSI